MNKRTISDVINDNVGYFIYNLILCIFIIGGIIYPMLNGNIFSGICFIALAIIKFYDIYEFIKIEQTYDKESVI